jgi:hypothetical protein
MRCQPQEYLNSEEQVHASVPKGSVQEQQAGIRILQRGTEPPPVVYNISL